MSHTESSEYLSEARSRRKSLGKKARGFLKSNRRFNSFASSCHAAQTDDDMMKYQHYVRNSHVTGEVHAKIREIRELVRDMTPCRQDKVDIVNSLLDWCSSKCSINAVVTNVDDDDNGYDLLQRVVAQGLDQIVAHILKLGFNIQLLNRPCTSPLHLACKKGHVKILEMFLDHRADMKFRSAVCYPTQHCNGASFAAEDGIPGPSWRYTNQNCCVSKRLSLITIALSSDNLDVLKVLMLHRRSKSLDTKMALYNACQREATNCLSFMAPLLPDQANSRYGYHDNSLFFVAFSKSINCGATLLKSDVTWKEETVLKTNPVGESLLHLVLRYHGNPAHENIFHLTKLAIQKCFPKAHINIADLNGNSPLLVLLKVIGRKVSVPVQISRQTSTCAEDVSYESLLDNFQRNWNEQVFDTVRYLVEQGGDVKAVNKAGETVLHALLKDHHARNLWGMYSSFYKEALPEIIRVMEYLLTFDLDVNAKSDQVSTPLVWVVHILSSLEVYSIETTWPSFSYLFDLLLEHGADPNILDEKGIHIISIVFTTANRWLNQCVTDLDLGRACRMLRHIASFVNKLFKHGVSLPTDILDLCVKQIMILCNVSIPAEVADQAPSVLAHVNKLLVPFFVNSVNPNKLHLATETHNYNEVPCKLHARFYLARAFIIHRQHDGMFQFLDMLTSALDQSTLDNLVSSICNILTTNFEDNSYLETSRCIEDIQDRRRTPRRLQVLCKVAISQRLSWTLKDNVGKLHLPKALQKYLLFNTATGY